MLGEIRFVSNEAAKNYLNGEWDRESTVDFLVKYNLNTREKAEKKLDFVEFYRSYVINYSYGFSLVTKFIEQNGGTEDDLKRRWHLFKQLLTRPQTPSGLLN